MNDRQVEALADELEGCANNPARDSTEAVVECDVLRRAVKALRSRTPSAPDVAMREALKKSYDLTMASRLTWRRAAEAAESRLAQAMKVIEPFARLATQHDEARRSGECHSWIDFLIDFHWPSEGSCTAARTFIAGNNPGASNADQ